MSEHLKIKIQDDMKEAMKQRDSKALAAIRLIMAAMKQKEVDERITLSDYDIIIVLEKMLKQRRDSLEQYQKAGREDLAAQEQFEITLIQKYMPAPLCESEIDEIIQKAITETKAESAKDMGKVMGLVKPKVQGRADIKVISDKIKQHLAP